jgi:ABC-type glutathione transport system ATPase component
VSTQVPVLKAERLSKSYRTRRGARGGAVVEAVREVSLDLHAGRITAVVGESGSGKSTTARMLLGLERPSGGRILLEGRDIGGRMTPDSVQMIFQDPFASLNPVHTVAHHVERAVALHRSDISRDQRADTVIDLLQRVQLTPPTEIAQRRPHQLSGGQRQRVSIARALAATPKVLLADEPVSMLDVSMRLGILNLLRDLAGDENLAVLYITHDIATARYFSETILVMHRGCLVEGGPADEVTQRSIHPYTRLLMDSAPDPDRLTVRRDDPRSGGSALAVLPGGSTGVVITECARRANCPHAGVRRSADTVSQLLGGGTIDEETHWAVCTCTPCSSGPEEIEAKNPSKESSDA